ncbi:sulfite exporter TauE/SafE family protein [Haloarcula sp. CBA1131]|nr:MULTISPECIES: sulfite exporter TauE/SafE family protein [unclassified Haloarcula]KAA9400840.1 sulfite exporter TauE/SafE family protein [Haloarcula sp. CBA1131]KAA9401137.1 sulfite exporter TauE/SafE family protein [Haloarcula sp. CBA1131]
MLALPALDMISAVLVQLSEISITSGYGLVVFFMIGLFGGAHCLGMCGPLVATYAERMETQDRWASALTLYEVRQHTLFNLGRTVSYAIIGCVFGAAGALLYGTIGLAGFLRPAQGVVGICIGVAIIVMGLTRLAGYQQGAVEGVVAGTGFGSLFARTYTVISRRVDRWVNGIGIIGLGALHGLLPCMLLYPAFLYAFAQGSPVYGLLSLGALGVGTIPSVFLYGTVIQSVSTRQRQVVHYGLGVLFVGLGYILVAMGLMRFGVMLPLPDIPYYQPIAESEAVA